MTRFTRRSVPAAFLILAGISSCDSNRANLLSPDRQLTLVVARVEITADPAYVGGDTVQVHSMTQAVTLHARGYTADSTVVPGASLRWTVSKPAVAGLTANSIGDSATVTSLANGHVKVLVRRGEFRDSIWVNVAQIATQLQVTPASLLMSTGTSAQLTATATDSLGQAVNIRVTSSAPSLATVDASGLVSAVGPGKLNIKFLAGGLSARVPVEVRNGTLLSSIVVTPAQDSVFSLGQTVALAAIVKDTAGAVLPGFHVTWTTANAGIATVDSNGVATSVGLGLVRITASAGGLSAYSFLRVRQTTATLTITGAPANLEVGDTVTATCVARDANAFPIARAACLWHSVDTGVLSVNDDTTGTIGHGKAAGLIRGNAEGTTDVWAERGGDLYPLVTDTITVHIVPRSVSLAKSTITAATHVLTGGSAEATVVTVQLKYGDGTNRTALGGEVVMTTTAGTLTDSVLAPAASRTAIQQPDGTYKLYLKAAQNYAAARITATFDGNALTRSDTVFSTGPHITSNAPTTLVPGTSATLTGVYFNTTPASNIVTIGGRSTVVTAATATQLTVTVPCVSTGPAAVTVANATQYDSTYATTVQVSDRHALAPGQFYVTNSSATSGCNELVSPNSAARYFVSVFNSGTSPTTSQGFQLSSDAIGLPGIVARPTSLNAGAPLLVNTVTPAQAEQQRMEEAHGEFLERNRAMGEKLMRLFPRGRTPVNGLSAQTVQTPTVVPPITASFRVPNVNVGNFCSTYFPITATRVYYDGKVAIYEDTATAAGFKGSLNPTMQDYYNKIGDQFNADMEPILTANFGDVLRRDAELDNNGVIIALFTPVINNTFSGVAGFVVSCDQFPNDSATSNQNSSSNFGEVFYAYQPSVAGTGYSGNTADNWYRTIRSTFMHEVKHLVAYSARVANNAPSFEQAWLEEGLARLSEELWERQAIDNLPWKLNHGYGSAANPVNVYCDVRPSGFPECLTNPRRPVAVMQRHFTSLYTLMFGSNARLLSPFGKTPSDNASYFYAVSWSFIRYTLDRYAASESAFLQALTQSTTSGATNITARAGVGIDQLLGGWSLSLIADDYPGGTTPVATSFPTWDLRNIYAGLNTDFPSTYTLAYPALGTSIAFGSFAAQNIATMYGGGYLLYHLSGTQTADQLLRLTGPGGAGLNTGFRIAVVRVQ